MTGKRGESYRVIDDFYQDLAYKLVELSYDAGQPAPEPRSDVLPKLAPNPLPEPDLPAAERHEIVLQGGMMGGMGGTGMAGMGGATWAMNGMAMTGDGQKDMPPYSRSGAAKAACWRCGMTRRGGIRCTYTGTASASLAGTASPIRARNGATRCCCRHAKLPNSRSSPITPATGCLIATSRITSRPG